MLDAASRKVSSGSDVTQELERIVIRTNPEPEGFELQRFFAAYLLSRSNLERSVRASGDRWLAPCVRSTYYRGYARDWRAAAKKSGPKSEEGEPLLPQALAALGADNALAYLDIVWMVVSARTGFEEEIGDVIADHPEFATVAGAEEFSGSLGTTKQVAPWVLWSLFEYHKTRNEPLAYRFGIRARELGRDSGGAFPESTADGIVAWILKGSKYVFRSSAGVEFEPGADQCSQTGEKNIDYQSQLKSE